MRAVLLVPYTGQSFHFFCFVFLTRCVALRCILSRIFALFFFFIIQVRSILLKTTDGIFESQLLRSSNQNL
ncbi:hypothetical protein P8452_34969 [Trifolium repens]|nr:hypothetical protein P8452_34969 [Trifolium repens]